MTRTASKGKSTVVWILMGMLVLGLGGFGIENFSGGGTDVGKVGNVSISSDDYARGMRQEMQGFSQMTGRALTGAEAREMGLPQNVLAGLFLSATLEEQANRLGVSAGDDAVRKAIVDAPAFRGLNGQFDSARYQQVLRDEGMSVREFEHALRMDEARQILQRAVTSGASAPAVTTDRSVAWLLETRDIRWYELTVDDLAAPIAAPDQDTLTAWHQANADRFTAPEARKLSFAWLTPDMIEDAVQVDDQALRDLYQSRIDEFQKPERRMVERLVFQDDAAANDAKSRLDSGAIDFEGLAAERGLTLADIDEGEVTQDQLGANGAAVFALEQPGVVGPLPTNLGPALFSMNAILEPVDVSFEQAKSELRGEAALDRARRQIADLRGQVDDLLAGGATVEDLANDTDMELGEIEWRAGDQPEQGSIAGYPAFREQAAAITEQDFPELHDLDDGGVFVLRLDEVVPPALIPFDEVRERVEQDWIAAETQRQLLALADERKVDAVAREIADPELTDPPAPQMPSVAAQSQPAVPNQAPVPGAASPRPQVSTIPAAAVPGMRCAGTTPRTCPATALSKARRRNWSPRPLNWVPLAKPRWWIPATASFWCRWTISTPWTWIRIRRSRCVRRCPRGLAMR
ncbi:SurA N-terminal domain-containing protein [Paracoccus sp. DMF-8]|uniref:SurA N-terminal domain-containing protein n=1 Tax=Paracoccus sp. DMF-8 TaxID=3019445 RepID=UPI0023E780A8|nr:SurA N-terminal domain-containing protein [Paracoccus sp. DMF-8]MDF3605930.1 SurA N-terminal domain-containing protein [Paracoccus sp. DMF-8]